MITRGKGSWWEAEEDKGGEIMMEGDFTLGNEHNTTYR